MNPEIKEQWIAALESGEYPKSAYALKTHEGYCCLGVLCELYAKTHNDGSGFVENHENPNDVFSFVLAQKDTGSAGFLPDVVADWAGIDRLELDFSSGFNDPQRLLSRKNDMVDTFAPVITLIKDIL